MKRSSTRNASDRVALTAARGTLEGANDTPKMQEVQVKLFHGEQADTIEHFHPYGFTAIPKKPSKDSSGVLRKAEGVVVFQNGSRSHPLVIVIGDRRYRLTGSQEGEVAIHDDQGQKVHLTRSGIIVDGGTSKLPITVQTGNATIKVKDGDVSAVVNKTEFHLKDGSILLGSSNASDPVMLQSGPSSQIFGVS